MDKCVFKENYCNKVLFRSTILPVRQPTKREGISVHTIYMYFFCFVNQIYNHNNKIMYARMLGEEQMNKQMNKKRKKRTLYIKKKPYKLLWIINILIPYKPTV
jgi:hypothetical protein